jgi:hypothetical protein
MGLKIRFYAAAQQALRADSRGAGFYGELSARAAQAQRYTLLEFSSVL